MQTIFTIHNKPDYNFRAVVMKRAGERMHTNRLAGVIAALHEKGYSEDFIAVSNGLTWVQEKMHIDKPDFLIDETHYFDLPRNGKKRMVLRAIALAGQVKGILLSYYD